MPTRKFVLTGSAAVLGLAIIGIPAMALAEDSPGGPPPSVNQPGNLSATVSQSTSGIFSVTLPGFGGLSFRVDPTTSTVTGVVVMPDAGVTAGAPVLREEGVEVPFSGPATTERLEVEVEVENGVPRVTAKAEGQRDQAEANRDDHGDDHGQDNDANDNDADDTPVQPGAVDEHHGDGDRDRDDDDNDAPAVTTTTVPMTTTTSPTAPSTSNRSPGGPPPQNNEQSGGPGSDNSGSNSGSNGSGDDGAGQNGSDDSGQGNAGQGGSGSGQGGPGH